MPDYLVFDGKRYRLMAYYDTKTKAKTVAKKMRKEGLRARVVHIAPHGGPEKSWCIYYK